MSATLHAQVAQTPPMGWNSYDSYGGFVNEAQVEANAQYMAANLKQYGFNTIVVDFCWSYPGDGSDGSSGAQLMQSYPRTNGVISAEPTPLLSMDANGELVPDPLRFPSSVQNGQEEGFTALAAFVHSLGLNFGIHIMRGVPVQAYYDNTPIAGDPGVTARQIANTADQAPWLDQMYGLATVNGQLTPGGQAYYNGLFDTYAKWGVDFVKADDMLSGTYQSADIAGMQKAIAQSGRSMVLSLSPGPAPLNQAAQLGQDGNMWRMLGDMEANWNDVSSVFAAAASWNQDMGPGHWPDADMLPLGYFVNPPVGSPGPSGLSNDQKRTVISLWSIIRSPLIFGGDLPSLANDPFTTSLLTNKDILAIDQNSLNNHQVSATGTQVVWEADVPNSNCKYLALFNIGYSTAPISTSFASLGLLGTASYDVKNLWTGEDLGQFTGSFSQSLGSDASGVYEIFNSAPTPKPQWTLSGSGDWNVLGNWSTGYVPDAVGAEADFAGSGNPLLTVSTSFCVTVGTLNFSSGSYVLSGAGSLTLSASAGVATLLVQGGNPAINLPVTIASNTVFNVATGSTLVFSGPITINTGSTLNQTGGGIVNYESTLTVQTGAALVLTNTTYVYSLALQGSAGAMLTANTGNSPAVLETDFLSMGTGSQLDLANNDLIVHNGSLAAISALVGLGSDNSNVNGSTGIISSVARVDSMHLTTLGVIQNSVGGTPSGSTLYDTFDGVAVTASDVLVKFTYFGDANLSGSIDGSDYSLIDNGYLNQLTGWYNGDFNYDGVVDGSDYTLIDNAFNMQGINPGGGSAEITAQIAATSAVPEPAAVGMISAGAVRLLARRKRSRDCDRKC